MQAPMLYLILVGESEDASSGVVQLIQAMQAHRK